MVLDSCSIIFLWKAVLSMQKLLTVDLFHFHVVDCQYGQRERSQCQFWSRIFVCQTGPRTKYKKRDNNQIIIFYDKSKLGFLIDLPLFSISFCLYSSMTVKHCSIWITSRMYTCIWFLLSVLNFTKSLLWKVQAVVGEK